MTYKDEASCWSLPPFRTIAPCVTEKPCYLDRFVLYMHCVYFKGPRWNRFCGFQNFQKEYGHKFNIARLAIAAHLKSMKITYFEKFIDENLRI